jgi:hypothetical protein
VPRVACLAIGVTVALSSAVVAREQEAAKTYKWVTVGGSGPR